jgi:hypothetical protein
MVNDDLLACPLEVAGEWPDAPVAAAKSVLTISRSACLRGVILKSDRQPSKLRVENRLSGRPSIWLHKSPEDTAWIMTDVGARDWCKLAYQFGHELGHVLCNSWQRDAAPHTPTQWLEELLVESFSTRGLHILADEWASSPPFRGNEHFSSEIGKYKDALIAKYSRDVQICDGLSLGKWYKKNRMSLREEFGLGLEQAAVPFIAKVLIDNPDMIADLGALNRWPERSSLELVDYINAWYASCRQIGLAGDLPSFFEPLLQEI